MSEAGHAFWGLLVRLWANYGRELLLAAIALVVLYVLWQAAAELFVWSWRSLQVPSDVAALARVNAQRLLHSRRPISLALGGGGAKGAYQAGCLKALEELDFSEFDAVAGTSVGALNAALAGSTERGVT
jgi:hypothetical protein